MILFLNVVYCVINHREICLKPRCALTSLGLSPQQRPQQQHFYYHTQPQRLLLRGEEMALIASMSNYLFPLSKGKYVAHF